MTRDKSVPVGCCADTFLRAQCNLSLPLVYLLYWYKSTKTGVIAGWQRRLAIGCRWMLRAGALFKLYLLYWYKGTNTAGALSVYHSLTCFTGTKVQILTLSVFNARARRYTWGCSDAPSSLLALLVQRYKY